MHSFQQFPEFMEGLHSFDIETDVPSDGTFPNANSDAVIQIGCLLSVRGEYAVGQTFPQVRRIFTLNTCSPIPGGQVLSFSTEIDMLRAWRQFFIETDPDIVTGYNILQFDIPFLLRRAVKLGFHDLSDLGRIFDKLDALILPEPHIRPNFYNCPDFEGRLIIDVMHQILLTDPEGKWLKLGDAGEGPNERRRLAVYCLKDAYLALQLMSRQEILEKHTERAKAAGIPMNMMRSPPYNLDMLSNAVRVAREAVEEDCIIADNVDAWLG